MADQAFEARLDRLFRDYAELGVRPIDRRAIASVVVASRPSQRPSTWRGARTWSWRIILAALLALALLGAALVLIGSQLNDRPVLLPTASPGVPSSGPTDAASSGPTATAAAISGPIALTADCLNVLDVVAGGLTQDCDGNTYPVGGGGTVFDTWSWAPGGDRAIGFDTNSLAILDRQSGVRTALPATAWSTPGDFGQTSFWGWSPLGTYFVWTGESRTPGEWTEFIGTVKDPRQAPIPAPVEGGSWCCVMWSANERRAIIPTDDTNGRIANGDGTSLPKALTIDRSRLLGLSQSGAQLAFAQPRGPVAVPLATDVAIGDGLSPPTKLTSFEDGLHAIAVAWLIDASSMAIAVARREAGSDAAIDYEIWLIESGTSTRKLSLSLPDDSIPGSLTSSADGVHLLVAAQEPPESYREWATVIDTRDGSVTIANARSALFSPDGQHAVYIVDRADGGFDTQLIDFVTGKSRSLGILPAGADLGTQSFAWK